MPYLKLIDLATRQAVEVRGDVARLGRSPECEVVLESAGAGVVSAVHAELRHGGGVDAFGKHGVEQHYQAERLKKPPEDPAAA